MLKEEFLQSHNPYFNRWFSAMRIIKCGATFPYVTILILIDGFLQFRKGYYLSKKYLVTILILIDGFLQL